MGILADFILADFRTT